MYVNASTLSLARVQVGFNNAATGDGPGIYNTGRLRLDDSIVSGNSAERFYGGGGIYNYSSSTLTISNSTLSGNSADYGGGIYNYDGTTTIINSTLSANYSVNLGGGLYNHVGTVIISNSALSGNSAGFGFGPNCGGTIASAGYNLLGNNRDCNFIATTGDQVGTPGNPIDPLLGLLQDNGGPTRTHALLTGSPAIDAGNPAGCMDDQGNLLTIDQRGYLRPVDGDGDGSAICDIGAYELAP